MTATPEPIAGRWPPAARLQAAADAVPPQPQLRVSTPDLIADVAADVSGIVRGELLLGRAETAANLKLLLRSGVGFGAALLLLSLAATFGTVALVVALAAWIGLLWSLLAMAGLCALSAGLLLLAARRGLHGWRLMPEQTMGRVMDDLDRLAARRADRTGERRQADSHA